MSFQAKLILGDDEYNILTAEYALNVPIDAASGRATGRVRGGIIDLTIESSNVNSQVLLQWITQHMLKDGRIEFYRRDTGSSTQKTVNFTNAFCIYMKDKFISDGANPMVTKITISSHLLTIDNERVTNAWAGVESSGSSGSSEGSSSSTEDQISFE